MTASSVAFRLAGASLLVGGAVHILAYLGGPHWLAVLGAPPSIVLSADRGTWLAPTGTFAIVGLLAVLALYCFSAADMSFRLPLRRFVLAGFAAVFLARGLLVVPYVLTGQREWTTSVASFKVSGATLVPGSLAVLMIGGLILFGLWSGSGRTRIHEKGLVGSQPT